MSAATAVDALNRATNVGGASLSYDARGNLTTNGAGQTYAYDADNRLVSGAGGLAFGYDALGRLFETAKTGWATTQLLYDGQDLIAEYEPGSSSSVLLRRYVHGPGADEPLVWYEGSGTSDRRFLVADERGSVVAVTDSSGAVVSHNAYDPYGKPGGNNIGRFQYTGQQWIAEAGLYYYKARFYNADLGRFMQTDPIGYADGMNLYAYVGGDPVNKADPGGTESSFTVCGFLSACFYGRLYMGEFIGGRYAGQSVKGSGGGGDGAGPRPSMGYSQGEKVSECAGRDCVVRATRSRIYTQWPSGSYDISYVGGGGVSGRQVYAGPAPEERTALSGLPFASTSRARPIRVPLGEENGYSALEITATSTADAMSYGKALILFGPRIPKNAGNGVNVQLIGQGRKYDYSGTTLLAKGVPTQILLSANPGQSGTLSIQGTTYAPVFITVYGLNYYPAGCCANGG